MSDESTAEQQELALASAGDRLREARKKQDLSLADIATETRIPLRHLEAIESGRLGELPARTYAVGFSRTYAKLVGLDEDEIVDLVREQLAQIYRDDDDRRSVMEPGDPNKLPSSGLAWFGAIGAILLVAGLLAFYGTYFGAGEGPASLLEQAEQLVGDDEAEAIATAEQSAETDEGIDPQGTVVFTALEDGVWVRFYESEGAPFLEKQMVTGEKFELPSSAQDPRINTGRPDAFAITIDGRAVPKLSEEPITIGNAEISAMALLARDEGDQPAS